MEQPLKGRTALVTGASRGIGQAIGELFHEAGARVAFCARDGEQLDRVVSALGGAPRALAVRMDVTNSDEVTRGVDEVAREFGHIDIVVNSAGHTKNGRLHEYGDADWLSVVDSNLTGTYRVTRAALPHIPSDGHGRVINISSVLGIWGVPETPAYVAAKHGVIGFTRSVALEVAQRGIRVNAVCPGWTTSAMSAQVIAYNAERQGITHDAFRASIVKSMPIGRLLEPREIAQTVLHLAGPSGSGITAQVFRVDGGQTPF